MVVILDHYGPSCRGILVKTSKLKPTGSSNGLRPKWWRIPKNLYQRVTQEVVAFVEKPRKIRRGLSLFLPCHHGSGETLKIEYPPLLISTVPAIKAAIDSLIWAIKTREARMSPCLTRRYISTGNQREADHYKGSCDSDSGSFDRSDYGCRWVIWRWTKFDGSDW